MSPVLAGLAGLMQALMAAWQHAEGAVASTSSGSGHSEGPGAWAAKFMGELLEDLVAGEQEPGSVARSAAYTCDGYRLQPDTILQPRSLHLMAAAYALPRAVFYLQAHTFGVHLECMHVCRPPVHGYAALQAHTYLATPASAPMLLPHSYASPAAACQPPAQQSWPLTCCTRQLATTHPVCMRRSCSNRGSTKTVHLPGWRAAPRTLPRQQRWRLQSC